MEITVKLYLNLRKYQNHPMDDQKIKIILGENATVEELIAQLKIPNDEVGLVLINGSFGRMESIIQEKDEIQCFPPAIGG